MNLNEIKKFCQQAHGEQRYGSYTYDGETYSFPYYLHLSMVAAVAQRFGFNDPAFLAACYGHDILEDTHNNIGDLCAAGFPEKSQYLIQMVTDAPGANRKERHERTYPHIAKDREAVALKLCDRLANVTFNLTQKNQRLTDMYRREYADFRNYLFNPEHIELLPLWEALDKRLA